MFAGRQFPPRRIDEPVTNGLYHEGGQCQPALSVFSRLLLPAVFVYSRLQAGDERPLGSTGPGPAGAVCVVLM
jgi:hypothetical protein